jgi:hypothetical protein
LLPTGVGERAGPRLHLRLVYNAERSKTYVNSTVRDSRNLVRGGAVRGVPIDEQGERYRIIRRISIDKWDFSVPIRSELFWFTSGLPTIHEPTGGD